MINLIPTVIKKFYDKWNIQCFILVSLTLQIILILFAPFRKRSRNMIVVLMIWIAYLLADLVANFAIGLISRRQGKCKNHGIECNEILTFWAPLLLLHHGGPDTITAFALEDNVMWLRHLFGLVAQVFVVCLVFTQSLPRNKLVIPTFMLLFTGSIKYCERVNALYLANLKIFKESMLIVPDPGLNYAKIMEEYASKKEANLPTQIELISEPNKESKATRYATLPKSDLNDQNELEDIAAVKHAHYFFETFKGLIVDLILSFHERDVSRQFFQKRTSGDAFKVLAIELNFMYEVFYTKVIVVHSRIGYFVRLVFWCALGVAFSTFYVLDKRGFSKIDVGITYSLLYGAMGLDAIALLKLTFSDWTAASIHKYLSSSSIWKALIGTWFHVLLKRFLTLKKINWDKTNTKSKSNCLDSARQCLELLVHPKKLWAWTRQILFRRWSESLHQYNLIDYCLKECRQRNWFCCIWIKVIDWLDLKDHYDAVIYVSEIPFTKKLWNFIFDELLKKSKLANDPDIAKRIFLARGDWVLQHGDWNSFSNKLMSYVVDVDYDQSLIIWHIATEICYNKDPVDNTDDSNDDQFCKILSDYMLYLLIMQPIMMSGLAGIGQIRFSDTCEEAKNFFKRKDPGQGRPKDEQDEHKRACEMILEVNTDVEPIALKGDKSKSVLFDACILAKELGKLEKLKRWKLMSEVWVELLSYAAGHCRAHAHVTQLSKGGEFITFVWLLMAHFGIGDKFQKNEGHARAKLVVGK